MMKKSKLATAAVEYINIGVLIVPLKPKSKRQFGYDCFREPLRTEQEVVEVWNHFPTANIAALTSCKYNNWIIIDVDMKFGVSGVDSLKKIIMDNGLNIPETCVAKTGTGGFHYYFKNVSGEKIKSSNGKILGIDVRANGAYVVLPPSIHKNGNEYEWIEGNINTMADSNEDVLKLVQIINKANSKECLEKAK